MGFETLLIVKDLLVFDVIPFLDVASQMRCQRVCKAMRRAVNHRTPRPDSEFDEMQRLKQRTALNFKQVHERRWKHGSEAVTRFLASNPQLRPIGADSSAVIAEQLMSTVCRICRLVDGCNLFDNPLFDAWGRSCRSRDPCCDRHIDEEDMLQYARDEFGVAALRSYSDVFPLRYAKCNIRLYDAAAMLVRFGLCPNADEVVDQEAAWACDACREANMMPLCMQCAQHPRAAPYLELAELARLYFDRHTTTSSDLPRCKACTQLKFVAGWFCQEIDRVYDILYDQVLRLCKYDMRLGLDLVYALGSEYISFAATLDHRPFLGRTGLWDSIVKHGGLWVFAHRYSGVMGACPLLPRRWADDITRTNPDTMHGHIEPRDSFAVFRSRVVNELKRCAIAHIELTALELADKADWD
jgi:hypothetical protein